MAKLMRHVRMKRTSAGDPYLRQGHQYFLDEDEANRLVESEGIAEYIDTGSTPATVEEDEPETPPPEGGDTEERTEPAGLPPAAETATAARAPEEATASPAAPRWPLRTKSPADYIKEHGDKPEADLSPAVRDNLAIARAIVAAEEATR